MILVSYSYTKQQHDDGSFDPLAIQQYTIRSTSYSSTKPLRVCCHFAFCPFAVLAWKRCTTRDRVRRITGILPVVRSRTAAVLLRVRVPVFVYSFWGNGARRRESVPSAYLDLYTTRGTKRLRRLSVTGRTEWFVLSRGVNVNAALLRAFSSCGIYSRRGEEGRFTAVATLLYSTVV